MNKYLAAEKIGTHCSLLKSKNIKEHILLVTRNVSVFISTGASLAHMPPLGRLLRSHICIQLHKIHKFRLLILDHI